MYIRKKHSHILQINSNEIGRTFENKTANGFRDGYIATLKEKWVLDLEGIIYGMKKTNFKISSYVRIVINAIYDEAFFLKI